MFSKINKKVAIIGILVLSLVSSFIINAGISREIRTSVISNEINTTNYAIAPVITEPDKNPSWFIFEQDPGKEISGAVIVKNLSSSGTLYAELYPVDASPDSGGFAPQSRDHVRVAASWITMEQSDLVLDPLAERTVKFTGVIPGNATPGQYAVGIMLAPKSDPNATQGSGKGVSIATRSGVRIYLTVRGEVKLGATIGDAASSSSSANGSFTFSVPITNSGNTIIKPRIGAVIYDMFGNEMGTIPENQSYEIQPGGKVNLSLAWEQNKPGIYKVKIKVSYNNHIEYKEVRVIVWPPIGWVLGGLAALLLIGSNIYLLLRKKKQPPVPPQVVSGTPSPIAPA